MSLEDLENLDKESRMNRDQVDKSRSDFWHQLLYLIELKEGKAPKDELLKFHRECEQLFESFFGNLRIYWFDHKLMPSGYSNEKSSSNQINYHRLVNIRLTVIHYHIISNDISTLEKDVNIIKYLLNELVIAADLKEELDLII